MAGPGHIPQLHAVFGPNGRLVCPHPPCNVTASQYWRMRDHILAIHYGILPWPCPRCPQQENGRVRLTRHINSAHPNEAMALNTITSDERGVYQYPATGQMVITYGDVVAHPPAGLPPVVPGGVVLPILGGPAAGAPAGGAPPLGAPHLAAPAPAVPGPAFGAGHLAPAVGHPVNPALAPHPAFVGHPAFVPQPVPQPGNAQPGNAQPGYAQPGYAQPGYAQPGYAQPGYAQPGNVQPVAQPGNAQPPAAGSPASPPAAPRPGFVSLPDLLLAQPWYPQTPYVGPAPLPRADPPAFIPPARPIFAASPPSAAAAGSSPAFAVGSPAGLAGGSPAPALPTFTVHQPSPSPPAPAAPPGSSPPGFATPGFATPGYMMPFGSSPPAFATPSYNLPYGSPPAALFNFNGPSAPNFNFGSPYMGTATGPTSFQTLPNLAAVSTGPSGSTFAFANPNNPNLPPPPTFASPNLAPAPGLRSAFASPRPAHAAAPTFAPQGAQNAPPANTAPAHVQDPNIAPPEYFMTGGRSPGSPDNAMDVDDHAQTQQQPASAGRSASSSNDSMDVDQYIRRDVDPNAQAQQSLVGVGQHIQYAPCGSIFCRCQCRHAGRVWCHDPTRGPGNFLQCPTCNGHG